MTRTSTEYNKIVGIKDDTIYVLEEIFQYEDGTKGAIGYGMRPLTQAEIDNGNDTENLRDLWKEAVRYDQTELGLEDYADDLRYNCEGYYPYDDDSFRYDFNNLLEKLPEKFRIKIENIFGIRDEDYIDWTYENAGCCFNAEDKWDVVIDKDLIEKIKEVEA